MRHRSWAAFGLFFFLTVHLLLSTFSFPAYAQFYVNTEAWMTASFPQAATAIPLIFNTLRAFFVIYLAVALVNTIRAARDGEDWLSAARSPAIVTVVVALGDVLATLITG